MRANTTLASIAFLLASGGGVSAQTSSAEHARLEVNAAQSSAGVGIVTALATTSKAALSGDLDIRAALDRTRLVQKLTTREISAATLLTDSLLAWRGALIDVGATTWLEGLRPAHYGGFVTADVRVGLTSALSARFSRAPIWRAPVGTDPLRAVRVRDLRALDRRIMASDTRIGMAFGRPGAVRTGAVEGGATRYSDGNARTFAAGRATLQLVAARDLRIAIEPNAYAESFSRSTAGFLTPTGYARAGLGVGFSAELRSITVSGLANPHAFRYAGGAGVGLDGRVSSALALGPGLLEVSADFMREGAYRYVQVSAGLGFRAH